MTLQQLQYVIAIVEHGSISETAKQLYVAQPTLSSAVRKMCIRDSSCTSVVPGK